MTSGETIVGVATLRHLAVVGILSSAALAGCSSDDARSTWTGSVTDSAGVTIVSNSDEPIWDDADRWTLEQDLIIGAVDGDPNYLFGSITGICVGTNRRIYVLDQAGTVKVRVYTSDGVFLDAFGQAGNGPGEMGNSVGPCLMAPGDTLHIPDQQNRRVNRYSSDGSSVGRVRFDIRDGVPVGWGVDTDGRILQQLRPLDTANLMTDGGVDLVVALSSDGIVTDTLVEFPSGGAVIRLSVGAGTFKLFATEPNWATTTDGHIIYGTNDNYWIGMSDGSGNLVRVTTKSYEPQSIGEADRAVVIGVIAEGMQGLGLPAAVIERGLGTLQFAEFYPAFHRLLSGPRGSIWAQGVTVVDSLSEQDRNTLSDFPGGLEALGSNPHLLFGSRNWDVFDADGRFLGEVAMPAGFTPTKFVGEDIYGVWKDELDVEYVMRLKVVIPE